MSSSWNAEESCIELTMRVEELNYTIMAARMHFVL